jgi:murein DD-endopeptidase
VLRLLLVAGLSLALIGQTRAPIVQSIDLSVPFAPVLFTQDGRLHIAYELHLTNFQTVDVSVNALRLTTAGGALASFSGEDLQRRIVRPGFRNDHATPHIVGPGQRAIVMLWFQLPPSVGARVITQAVDVEVMRTTGAVRAEASRDVTVEGWKPLNLGPPLRGGLWVAAYDPLLKGGHRTAVYTVDGRARIPGRFAIDFIKLPPSGALVRNLSPRPADLNGFGSDVLAVTDGTIAAALDDTPDDLPQPVAPERASGNYVSIDLGDGRFAFYEHLQQGSLLVKTGERVKRGQAIAKLGSSGSTSIGPHLHFHVADANALLGAEGLPFAFDQFTLFGDFASLGALVNGEQWRPGQVARGSATTRPAPNVVLSFR